MGSRRRLIASGLNWIGGIGTVLWLVLAFIYAFFHVGIGKLGELDANQLGDFFAGVAAPLAFFWLVIGYVLQRQELALQREELKLQREEMKRSAQALELQAEELKLNRTALEQQIVEMKSASEQARRQAEAVSANELHTRKGTYFRLLELTESILLQAAFEIFADLAGYTQAAEEWPRINRGERDRFYVRATGSISRLSQQEFDHRFMSRANFASEIGRYCEAFEVLLREVPDDALRSQLMGGASGRMYYAIHDHFPEQ